MTTVNIRVTVWTAATLTQHHIARTDIPGHPRQYTSRQVYQEIQYKRKENCCSTSFTGLKQRLWHWKHISITYPQFRFVSQD